MPLTTIQKQVLFLLAANRSEDSHLAGAAGLHMSEKSPRRSADIDLFHDCEQAVAMAFKMDRQLLESNGYTLSLQFSQPGYIRAIASDRQSEQVRIDWAYDSVWRFMPAVKLENAGYVLHPVDLAVNKVLALIGREEPRDFIDVVYLHQRVLPLGALAWAACGKDPGLNPQMVLELLSRRGRIRPEELQRLDLAVKLDPVEQELIYRKALEEGRSWQDSRPPEEAGCLYRRPQTGCFFAPHDDEPCVIHRGSRKGVLPMPCTEKTYVNEAAERTELESFFEQRISRSRMDG